MSGFTTTPEERLGPGPPYTNLSLQANLILRVFLGMLACLASVVPMRLLWRNGEFAAATLYVVVTILNVYYFVNALIWPDNNVQNWYAGYGWCDLQVYTIFPLETVYSACIFAVMRNLANRVGLMRATSLSAGERKRRNIIEALIIFPVALLQVLLTYFVLAQRYNVSTLIGCTSAYDPSWPFFVFFELPSPIYTFGAAIYAILTWKRFREVDKATRVAMNTNNSTMAMRHNRMRRKLYFMAVAIIVPFLPIQFLFLAYNMMAFPFPLKPYDFKQIHFGMNPFPFEFISFTTSDRIGFIEMNASYIAVISVAPLFWYFGLTKDAINTYRKILLSIGLGRVFPSLHEEYDPDRSRSSGRTCRQQVSNILSSTWTNTWSGSTWSTSSRSVKEPVLPTSHHISLASSAATRNSSDAAVRTNASANPWPDVPPASHAPAGLGNGDDHVHEMRTSSSRNPFIFRTAMSTPLRFPPLRIPSIRRKVAVVPTTTTEAPSSPGMLLRPLSMSSDRPETGSTTGPAWVGGAHPAAKVHTRVWSEEDGDGPPVEMVADGPGPARVRVETQIARRTETIGKAV